MKTKRVLEALLASVSLLAFAAPTQSAPVFLNASFEDGVSTGWDSMNATNTPGWSITTGTGGFFPALNLNIASGGPYGNNNHLRQFATLGGPRDESGGGSALAQTISGFTVNSPYVLSWIQSSEFTEGDWVTASISGAAVLSQDFYSNPYPGGSQFWEGWQTMTYAFVADAATLTFKFNSATGRGFFSEPGIDSFGIVDVGQSIPEPASLALVGIGLAGLGAMRRRKA